MSRSSALWLVLALAVAPACKKKNVPTDYGDDETAALLASIPPKAPAIDPNEKLVDAAFAKQGRTLDACHADAQNQAGAAVAGTVKVSLVVKNGALSKGQVVGNDTGNDYLGTCVIEAIRGWKFPSITEQFSTTRELSFGDELGEEGGEEGGDEGEWEEEE